MSLTIAIMYAIVQFSDLILGQLFGFWNMFGDIHPCFLYFMETRKECAMASSEFRESGEDIIDTPNGPEIENVYTRSCCLMPSCETTNFAYVSKQKNLPLHFDMYFLLFSNVVCMLISHATPSSLLRRPSSPKSPRITS
ncbi:hypothetical protein P691DRAFT_379785 [Macrolepiota fuliginosa MF-IS2]|uniref:Uncharacterized protein n=1 Tax=Macrolepiota fuliginosa MF-IS2 TaxID=1400762 RepID=A0A9P5XID3_9AGAR|nr:hypothetical protein P691DRAFT_379785 [Macrolepiota fuliginosa MF-IS2]